MVEQNADRNRVVLGSRVLVVIRDRRIAGPDHGHGDGRCGDATERVPSGIDVLHRVGESIRARLADSQIIKLTVWIVRDRVIACVDGRQAACVGEPDGADPQ